MNQKYQKDCRTKYKRVKSKLALLEAGPLNTQSPKPLQPKIKGFVAETFDWDEEAVSEDEDMIQVKVLMALADDELIVGKNHARNGEWIDITMRKVNILLFMDVDADWLNYLKYINIDIKFVEEQRLNLLSKYNKIVFELNKCSDDLLALKQAKLDAVTFQNQNTELTKLYQALQEQLKEERKVNEKWLNSSNKVSQCINEQIPNQKKKILRIEQLTESSSKNDVKENSFIHASLDYDHEIVLKSKDWVESYDQFTSRHNRVILVRGGLDGSSQSSESFMSVSCTTCESNVHSTTDYNDFEHFKRETHKGAHLVPGQRMLKEYDWYQELSTQICRATSMEAIRFTNTSIDEIRIDDSSIFPPDEFLHEDNPSR
ncbi:hypothetical protein Tco_0719494 [Tanacetum coccineum]